MLKKLQCESAHKSYMQIVYCGRPTSYSLDLQILHVAESEILNL